MVAGDDDTPFVVLGKVAEDSLYRGDDVGSWRTRIEEVTDDEKAVSIPFDHEFDDPSERFDEIVTPDVPFLPAEALELRTYVEVGRVNEMGCDSINPPGPSM